MTSRALPLLSLLALLATGATWLLLGAPRDAHVPEAATLPAAQEEGAAGDLAASAADPASAADADHTEHPQDAQRQELPAFPAESGGPTLRVVAAATKRAVPFAEVFVSDSFALGRSRVEAGPSDSHWASVLERGTPRRADAEGRVALPPVRRRLMVAARSEGLFGIAVVRENEREPVLELAADKTLRVRVTDVAGAPVAGVNVALCADLRERVRRVSRAPTGRDGIAEVRHVQLYETRLPQANARSEQARARDRFAREYASEHVRSLFVEAQARVRASSLSDGARAGIEESLRQARIDLQREVALEALARDQQVTRIFEDRLRGSVQGAPGARDEAAATQPLADFVVLVEVPQAQPVRVQFAAQAVPDGIVELRLPATSSLIVNLLGPDGAELATPCRITLRLRRETPVADPKHQASIDQLSFSSADKPLGQNKVVLAPVGLGLRFDAHVEFADGDLNFAQDGVAGPTTAAPHEVVVRTPDWLTTIAGRLVDDRGASTSSIAPGSEVDFFLAGARGRVENERLRLGVDSVFELPVRLRSAAPPYSLEVQVRAGDRRLGKLIALPALSAGRRNVIGDIALADLPALASGRVRDDLGQPLVGAQIVTQVQRGEAWTDESSVRATTDVEGRFVLHGAPRPQRLRLHAQAKGHAPDQRAITFGDDVEWTLLRTGAIRAEGALPAFVGVAAVRVALTGGGASQEVAVQARPDQRFELHADNLRPGSYDLALRVVGLPRPLAIADRVVVQPGQTTRPPTIDGLDLRGRLFRYVVRAAAADGSAIANPGAPLLVELHDTAGAPRMVAFTWRGPLAEFVADQPSVSVVGLANGYRPARALLQSGDATLTFARVHPLHLRLPGLRALLGATRTARISLVFLGDTGLPDTDIQAFDQRTGQPQPFARAALGKSGGAPLGNADEVTVPLMFNGPYEIILRVDGPSGRASKRIGTVEAILDGPTPQTATVTPDPAAVRAAGV